MRTRLPALVLVAASVAAAAGCHRKRSHDTVTTDPDVFATDDFPGDPVQDGNVADDLRALSPSGVNVLDSARVTFNGHRGTAMLTYGTDDGQLYAHYYDGDSWTPPVPLTAVDADLATCKTATVVAFVNTEDHPSDAARERDGDAVILWSADDEVSGAGDGANSCLFATYFDVDKYADSAARHGFHPDAQRLSTIEDANVGGIGEDIRGYCWISDGLCGETRWNSSPANGSYQWGDSTTGLVAMWCQREDNDPVDPAFQADVYWAYSAFDLAQPGDPDLPLVGGPMTRGPILGFGALDSGNQSEETVVASSWVVYNNVLFLQVASDGDAGSAAGYTPADALPAPPNWGATMDPGDDVTLQVVAFDLAAGTPSPVTTLHVFAPDSSPADTGQCMSHFIRDGNFFNSRNSVFGPDEGLSCIAIYTLQLITDVDTDFGELTLDGRLVLSLVDPADGSVLDFGLIDPEDGDISDSVDWQVKVRMSRNGDAIWAAFSKEFDDGPAGPSAEDYNALWVSQLITTRLDEDGNAPPLPPLTDALQPALMVSPPAAGWDINGFQFQLALGYRCGIQSDPDVMHVLYEHSGSMIPDQLFIVRLTSDLDPAGGAAPSISISLVETFMNDGEITGATGVFAVDAGADGDVFVCYRQDTDPSALIERHGFLERLGASPARVQIDSAVPGRTCGSISAVCVPPGEEIGAFDLSAGEDDDRRPHPARLIHLVFREDAVSSGDGLAEALRTRRVTLDPDVPLAESFTPALGELPFSLGVPGVFPPPSDGPYIVNPIMVREESVGFVFEELDHLYYQEAGPTDLGDLPWYHEDGLSDPALIDDDSPEPVAGIRTLRTRGCLCDSLSGFAVLWSRVAGGSSFERFHIRMRSDEE
jgi:hypothetical protein